MLCLLLLFALVFTENLVAYSSFFLLRFLVMACQNLETPNNLVSTGDLSLNSFQQGGVEAKWFKWRKTRDEIFGVGIEPWVEGWAMDLIFGAAACAKQEYLWRHLVNDRHMQFGSGLLRIPAEWKKKRRQKQRSNRLDGRPEPIVLWCSRPILK